MLDWLPKGFGPSGGRPRRGASAIEFALVLPVVVTLLVVIFDYGWFFLRESLVMNVLHEAVRTGSFQAPGEGEASFECSACQERTATLAVAGLAEMNVTVEQEAVTPTIEGIAGTCALVLAPSIPHTAIIGLVPVPGAYAIRVVAYAQNLSGC